jgi:hypothetical protein
MTDITNEIDAGGSAFPIEGGADSGLHPDPGMTLRDKFAESAMNGIVSSIISGDNYDRLRAVANGRGLTLSQWIARDAYKQADAMIVERQKEGAHD